MVDHIDLNWADFTFNLISMCIVYAYFSKAAGPHESITAVLLCMAVAAFDILLLLLRWLWCDPFISCLQAALSRGPLTRALMQLWFFQVFCTNLSR
jgi:Kef-type K+ transport system membrane component KefB